MVGNSVVDEIKIVFQVKQILADLNKTLITLIPKIKGPETIGNFRLVSLCNSIYKIITKIIVARIRPHLEKLVSPY